MQLATLNANTVKAGTCPHGLPLGACPICNGMGGGGGMRKADFSAKPGEMSWNECAAIGAFLKAQANAKARRQQDLQNYALHMQNFQTSMANARARVAELAQFFTQNTPAIIAKPVNFVLYTVLGGTLNIIKNLPAAITPSARNCLGTNTPHINAEPSPNALTNIFTVLLFFTNELKKKVIARHIRAYTTVLAKRKAPAAVNIAPLYKIHDVMKYKAIIPNATRKHPLAI